MFYFICQRVLDFKRKSNSFCLQLNIKIMYNYIQILPYKHIKIKVEKFSAHWVFHLRDTMQVYYDGP